MNGLLFLMQSAPSVQVEWTVTISSLLTTGGLVTVAGILWNIRGQLSVHLYEHDLLMTDYWERKDVSKPDRKQRLMAAKMGRP